MSRIYNFSAGPATLPVEVLEQAQNDLVDYQGIGMSIMEATHRGKAYEAVHAEAQANLRELMGIPEEYAVLFVQGGASMQFGMVPMNLLGAGQVADYTNSGAWGEKAIKDAQKLGSVNIAADTCKDIPTRVPTAESLKLTAGAAYVHITSNETISGAQWKRLPKTEAPLVADMSSDILSRPINVKDFGLIYAGAQKNLGPSGVTLVIIRKDLAERCPKNVPVMLKYGTHIENDSLYNTPPCFGIYVLMLVTRWIKKQGVENLYAQNVAKAKQLYDAFDGSGGYYTGTAVKEFRSDMNVTFRLPSEALEATFLAEASKAGFKDLKGHRMVGGIRASIYNAFPVKGVDDLVAFMRDFQQKNG
ncbi:MAG: 3-phosphoserine/phosphohydroxythreonine transaminase [Kiritimatiellaeota bacterium]|nr:3-phosphoserine/phosphohydroxythreonine transaminase [Kiritimatiellota bacterium]